MNKYLERWRTKSLTADAPMKREAQTFRGRRAVDQATRLANLMLERGEARDVCVIVRRKS